MLDEAAKQSHAGAEFLINLSELYANLGVQIPAQKEAANAKALQILKRAEKLNPATAVGPILPCQSCGTCFRTEPKGRIAKSPGAAATAGSGVAERVNSSSGSGGGAVAESTRLAADLVKSFLNGPNIASLL